MLEAIVGGLIIGLASILMLLLNGRIAGVSGIILGALRQRRGDFIWRLNFFAGLLAGGIILRNFYSSAFSYSSHTETWMVILAGVLVGFGTSLGSGCTSGHGVCGIARFSARSILATVTFMLSGALAATILRGFLEGAP